MISNYRMVPFTDEFIKDRWAVQKCIRFFIFTFWTNVMSPLTYHEAATLLENLQKIELSAWKKLEGAK